MQLIGLLIPACLAFVPFMSLRAETIILRTDSNAAYLPYSPFSINEFIREHDRKQSFVLPYDPYANEEHGLEKDEAMKRLKKFANTYVADALNRKYSIFEKKWGQSEDKEQFSGGPGTSETELDDSASDSLHYDFSYRVRARYMRLNFNSGAFFGASTLWYNGNSQLELARTFNHGDIEARYTLLPRDQEHMVTLKKDLANNLWAQTTVLHSFDHSSGVEQIFEILYSREF